MALSIVTNTISMKVQSNLTNATDAMNTAIERMTTGYKVNQAKDDAAGYNIIDTMTSKIGSYEVASDNAQIGLDMLATAEENYSLLTEHLQRIRDLMEQAANGTYSDESREAIAAEIQSRMDEINRVAAIAEYNGLYLMNGDLAATEVRIQVGLYGEDTSAVILDGTELFTEVSVSALMGGSYTATQLASSSAANYMAAIDAAITDIASRVTNLGAAQNRLESAMTAIESTVEQLTASRSTMRDADVASESTDYISAQILQSAAASLLSVANQTPSIALQLI